MSKRFFRFLRGEINGFYLKNIHDVMNVYTVYVKNFLADFKRQQFEAKKLLDKYLYGLGKFAGIFLPRISRAESQTSLRMTDSNIKDGYEFSERGLFSIEAETFYFFKEKINKFFFVRTTQEVQSTDINTEATRMNRSSLVGDEVPIGFISSEETDLFDEEGNVKPEKILTSPPEDVAYTEFYGDSFLMLSEGDGSLTEGFVKIRLSESDIVDGEEYSERGLFNIPDSNDLEDINDLATIKSRSSLIGDEEVIGYISSEAEDVLDDEGNIRTEFVLPTPPSNVAYSDFYGDKFLILSEAKTSCSNLDSALFIELFKAFQIVSYNGASLTSFCKIVDIICPEGLVKISDIQPALDGKHLIAYYVYDESIDIPLKQQRLTLLEYIVSVKFVQVKLAELASNI